GGISQTERKPSKPPACRSKTRALGEAVSPFAPPYLQSRSPCPAVPAIAFLVPGGSPPATASAIKRPKCSAHTGSDWQRMPPATGRSGDAEMRRVGFEPTRPFGQCLLRASSLPFLHRRARQRV